MNLCGPRVIGTEYLVLTRGHLHLAVDNGAGNSFAAGAVRMLLLEHKRLKVVLGLADSFESARSLPLQNKCRQEWRRGRRKRLLHKRDLEQRA